MSVEGVACVAHSLGNRKISVVKLNVLSDKSDMYGAFSALDLLNKVCPLGKIGSGSVNIQLTANNGGEICLFEHKRCFVKIGNSDVLNYAVGFYVAEH